MVKEVETQDLLNEIHRLKKMLEKNVSTCIFWHSFSS